MKPMNYSFSTGTIKTIFVGVYAWLTTISFGLVLLDILYAGLVPNASTALREAADFLLFINALSMLAALGAIGSSFEVKTARNFMAASLAVTILGLLLNMALAPHLGSGSPIGAFIRVLVTGSISILAFMGFYKYSSEPFIKISYI